MREIQNVDRFNLVRDREAIVEGPAFVGYVEGDVCRGEGRIDVTQCVQEVQDVDSCVAAREANFNFQAAVVAAEEEGFEVIIEGAAAFS